MRRMKTKKKQADKKLSWKRNRFERKRRMTHMKEKVKTEYEEETETSRKK